MQYIRIPVDDVATSASFYADLLDAPADVHPSGDYAEVERGDVLLALFGPGLLPKENGTPLDREPVQFQLAVADTARAITDALRWGARLLSGSTVADADGHRITLH